MQSFLDKLKSWWETADRTQRTVTVGGAAFLVILLIVTGFLSTRSKMVPVYPGATAAEQGDISEAVAGYGMAYEISPSGDVMVSSDKVAEARMMLAKDGKQPVSSSGGTDILGGAGYLQTPAEERERFKRLHESKLSTTIESFEGVAAAQVHINFGDDSPFAGDEARPSAAVQIQEKGMGALGPREGRMIARMVQRSVESMTMEDVTVVSATGSVLFDGEEQASGGDATQKLAAERSEGKRRERELQARLDHAFGPGATVALVNVELNMDQTDITQTTETPSDRPIRREGLTETLDGSGDSAVGPAGAGANVLGAAPTANGPDSSYSSEANQEEYGTNRRTETIAKAQGEVVALNVNVMVDSARVTDPAAVQSFVRGYMATKGERNFQATVTQTEFSTEAVEAQKDAAAAAKSGEMMQQFIGALPILALIAVGFMLVRAIKTAPVRAEVIGESTLPAEEQIQALPSESPSKNGAAPEGEGDTYITMQMPNREVEVGAIASKVDVPLEQIRHLSNDKPETIAMLLKSWMADS